MLHLADTVTALPQITPLDQEAVMFLREGENASLCRGYRALPQVTLEYLAARRCDLISMDCAFCMAKTGGDAGASGLSAFREHGNSKKQGTADENTVFIAQHFSIRGLLQQ